MTPDPDSGESAFIPLGETLSVSIQPDRDFYEFKISLKRFKADDICFYFGEKYDDVGNIIGENSAEERMAWFEETKGKLRHRLICSHEGMTKTLEGPEVLETDESRGIIACFTAIGEEIAIRIKRLESKK